MIKQFFSIISKSGSRIYGLDILRFIAITTVVVGHGMILLPTQISYILSKINFDGVILFFVLSGFLIGGILIKSFSKENMNLNSLIEFWKRRWWRTLPNYYLILLFIGLHVYISGNLSDLVQLKYLNYFFFWQNFAWPQSTIFPESWSLSVEEWFYLLIPALLFGVLKLFRLPLQKAVPLIGIAIIAGVLIYRFYKFTAFHPTTLDEWDLMFRKQVVTRLDSIMFGVIGAYVYNYHLIFWEKIKKSALVFGVLIFLFVKFYEIKYHLSDFGFFRCVLLHTLEPFGFLLLFPFMTGIKNGDRFFFKLITTISIVSYSMYLLHYSIVLYGFNKIVLFFQCNSFLEKVLIFILYLVMSTLAGIILYKFYEKPMMDLRDRNREKPKSK